MSVDARTRPINGAGPADPASFFEEAWREAAARHGARAAEDAARLGLPPITIRVDDAAWTLQPATNAIDVVPGSSDADASVALDRAAFADLFCERRTALGLVIGGRTEGDPASNDAFCAWDPVLRSLLDGRPVYRPGDVSLLARDGSPLDLGQRFRLGETQADAAHFLGEAGFLLLRDVFTEAEMDAVDADLGAAVRAAQPDDGTSWWASTRGGEAYPCRILDFAQQSPALRSLIAGERYVSIGNLLADGHRPGDPFGEHFADVTAEGLLKRVGSVDGLVCLPWHKDCDRGGHSMFCCGLTIGVCLTPVDEDHGGLDVMAGSHRANIARAQVNEALDLPAVTLRAERGDVTVHMSCTLHRSTHPMRRERRVAYTGFALPPRPGDGHAEDTQAALRRDRAAIGVSSGRALFAADDKA
jgi:Phytanoyl-CoA dioxygenase (PhyH)